MLGEVKNCLLYLRGLLLRGQDINKLKKIEQIKESLLLNRYIIITMEIKVELYLKYLMPSLLLTF